MPLVQINMFEGRTAEQKSRLLRSVADAVHESTGAPYDAIRVWIYEFGPDEFVSGKQLEAERETQTPV